jgi:hypothetical protein
MPATYQTMSQKPDCDRTPAWIALASMFVGYRLDKWGAIGAYVAAVATLTASVAVLLYDLHKH